MRLIRQLFVLACTLTACGAIWAAVYARREGFTESWRKAIAEEFEKRGYHVEIGKLTLGAFRGLVAEDVRFFQDATRKQEIAYLDDVFLDVDLSRIFNSKQVSINTLDVQEASLSLPLDPSVPNGRRLLVTGLSGRIVITESVIEIMRAEAEVVGVGLKVRGTLLRPPLGEEENKEKDPSDEFASQRRLLLAFLKEFETYEFTGGRPTLEVEFRGDLDDLATTTARARLAAPAFQKKGQTYQVASLDAFVKFDGLGKRAEIEELKIRDEKGALDITGQWSQESDRLDFTLSSTADISGLAGLFTTDRKLGEVVFFTPPTIEASGHLLTDRLKIPLDGLPGEIIGSIRSDRFVTRGTVFSGIDFGFSAAEDRFYIRSLRLDHKTGSAFLNLKYEPGAGETTVQYQTEIKLDPLVFRPFFNERGRKFIDAWNFSENSSVYIAAVGNGENWSFSSWKNRGVIDLRQFRLNGVDFLELETDYESDGETQWFRNASLVREEGRIVAELAQNDRRARTWDVKGVVSTVDPVAGARAFNPRLSVALEKYRHERPPTIRLAGRLDGRRNEEVGNEPRRNELTVSFTGGGDARYDFLGKTLTLTDPVGEVKVEGSRVHLVSLTGGIFGGRIDLEYDVRNVRAPNAPFEMSATIAGVPLEAVTRHYGESDSITGSVDAQFRLTGNAGLPSSFNGAGSARISEGHLFAIPVLGPLSKLIASGSPNNADAAHSVAREASASFLIENGVLGTQDLEALTQALRIKAAGTVSLVDQSVDLEAVVNTRGGLSSTILTPVSELLTYSCSGTLKEPVWKAKHISNIGKVPVSLISELTNIPVEGLKKLGQFGQGIFGAAGKPAPAPTPEEDGSPVKRRFPWGGMGNNGGSTEGAPQPRRLFPLRQN